MTEAWFSAPPEQVSVAPDRSLRSDNLSNMENSEAETRRSNLLADLEVERKEAHKSAQNLEIWINRWFWVQMIALGSASFLGLIPSASIKPWMISILAAVAAGCLILVREAKYREKADWFYARRDVARSLINRLKYEMPEAVSLENVAAISKEFRQTKENLGLRMKSINARGQEAKD
jgi:hypothetical protein